MTDNFNYQDVIKTNIPELDQNITLHAKYLLGAAQNTDFKDPEITDHLRSHIDTSGVTQAIWELAASEEIVTQPDRPEELIVIKRPQRLLAITVMGDYFRVGLDRRPTSEHPAVRWSANGYWLVGSYEVDTPGEEHQENFYDVFYETVAAMGLRNRLVQVYGTQNESSSAILANAA